MEFNKNAIPLYSSILRKGLTLWGDIPRLRKHGNARTERGAHTEHEKARVVPLSRPPSAPRRGPRWLGGRETPPVSVRFHGNNVRHWRNGLFPSQQALPLPSDSPVPLRRCRSPPPAVQIRHRPSWSAAPSSISATATFGRRRPAETDTTGRLLVRGCSFAARDCAPFFEAFSLNSLPLRRDREGLRRTSSLDPQPISSLSLLYPHRQYGLISEGTRLPHASVLRFLREVN